MATSTVEDYLKAIYVAEQRVPGELVTTGQIAQAVNVTPGTATAMAKTLADAGLAVYEPYSGVRLTPAGNQLAMHVLRRHRLVELFLVEVMGLDWTEVHGEAEVLEHAVSERLIERMDEMLGHPASDPHGDPIPTAHLEFRHRIEHCPLSECAIGETVTVARLTDQRAEFLQLIERNGLRPGRRLAVASRDPLADTVDIRTEDGGALRLGLRVASRILVERPPGT